MKPLIKASKFKEAVAYANVQYETIANELSLSETHSWVRLLTGPPRSTLKQANFTI